MPTEQTDGHQLLHRLAQTALAGDVVPRLASAVGLQARESASMLNGRQRHRVSDVRRAAGQEDMTLLVGKWVRGW